MHTPEIMLTFEKVASPQFSPLEVIPTGIGVFSEMGPFLKTVNWVSETLTQPATTILASCLTDTSDPLTTRSPRKEI